MVRKLVILALSCVLTLGGLACGGAPRTNPDTQTEFNTEELRRLRDSGEGLSARERELLQEAERAEAMRMQQQQQ